MIENYLGLVGTRYHNRWWWDSTRNETRTMGLVAEVDVRARVPFGFHGAWLGAEEMRKTRLGEGGNGEVRVDVGDG